MVSARGGYGEEYDRRVGDGSFFCERELRAGGGMIFFFDFLLTEGQQNGYIQFTKCKNHIKVHLESLGYAMSDVPTQPLDSVVTEDLETRPATPVVGQRVEMPPPQDVAGIGGMGPVVPRRRRSRPPRVYRIGEVVEYSGMSRQTVHNYTTMGLLRECRWTAGGHRLYDESVFERLDQIAELKARRRSLQDIREYFARLDSQ